MSQQWFGASAPASCMLSGEHAVLHGEPALVGAIEKRLHVQLRWRDDNLVYIHSDKFGYHKTVVNHLSPPEKPFQFVLAVLNAYQKQLKRGVDINISSEFSEQIGFGSSAAVTVAVLHALHQALEFSLDQIDLVREARDIVRAVQGTGSGADIAAAVYGGVVYYEQEPLVIKQLPPMPDVHLVYTGYKTPTPQVIGLVEAQRLKQPGYFQEVFKKIGTCTKQCYDALLQKNFIRLGELFKQHQTLLAKLGVSSGDIDELVDAINRLPHTLGSKISGSGLGDCILAIGKLPAKYFPHNKQQAESGVQQFSIQISASGLIKEKIFVR